jgi:hypothetical protein
MSAGFLNKHFSVKQRLITLCGAICLISCIPLCAYFLSMTANWDFNDAEQRGIAPTYALLKLTAQVQRLRELAGLARALDRDWQEFDAQWAQTGVNADVGKHSAELRAQTAALQDQVAHQGLSPEDSLRRHGGLADGLLAMLFEMNGSDNMLFDPEDSTYLLIIAGFQEGPRVTELAARLRVLRAAALRATALSPGEMRYALDTHGRLQERIAQLQVHLKAAALRKPASSSANRRR